jgi:Protein of unknown function (DUF3455)
MKATALLAALMILGLSVTTGAQPSLFHSNVPPVPPGLEVPAGHDRYLVGYAVGTQNYVCVASASGLAWRFTGPQATLFLTFWGAPRQQVTTHFLSADPTAIARPTWQHSFDSSRVWGRAIASSMDPNYVEAGAIPWLLVEATGTAVGPMGGRALAQTTFIQRLNTSGGVAPSNGCSDASHVGAQALVPYTTDYFFYRADRGR